VPEPREIVVSGRTARLPGLIATLSEMLGDLAPVIELAAGTASTAARGGALLADGLAGGDCEPLVRTLELRDAAGTVLDHLRVLGSDAIVLG
jgi:predicted butyrate kinase (DUF1464 family)